MSSRTETYDQPVFKLLRLQFAYNKDEYNFGYRLLLCVR